MYRGGPQAREPAAAQEVSPAVTSAEPLLHIHSVKFAELVRPVSQILRSAPDPQSGQLTVALLLPGCSCWAL